MPNGNEAFLGHIDYPILKMLLGLDWGFYFEIFEHMWDNFGIGSKSKHEIHLYLSPEGHLHTISGLSSFPLQSVTRKQVQSFHFQNLVGTWEVLDFGPSQILHFGSGITNVISSKCKSYVSDVCNQVLSVMLRLWGSNQLRVKHLIFLFARNVLRSVLSKFLPET